MSEAYNTAMRKLKMRCETHKVEHGDYPATLEVSSEEWEVLRAGMHASKAATHLNIPIREDTVPVAAFAGQSDGMKPLQLVMAVKAEKQ